MVAVLLALSVSPAQAEEGAIRLESWEIVNEFPEGFRIKAEADGDNEIVSMAVRLRIGRQTHGAYDYLCQAGGQGEGDVLPEDWICDELVTGKLVDGELFWRTNSRARYIPPGTILTYNLEVEDSEGNFFKTEPQEFLYDDTRFEWKEVSEGPITVSYHGPVETRANIILDAMVQTLGHMAPLLGADVNEPIRVTMFNNVKEMLDALPPGSATVGRELVTEGQAFSEMGTLLILGSGQLAEGTASHEMTHILVYRASQCTGCVPSWLNEGLAEYGNIVPGYSYDIALDFAVETDRLMPFTSMSVTPGDPEAAIIFYGQSRSLVRMLIQEFGAEKMRELMERLETGRRPDRVIQSVYGLSLLQLDDLWRQAIGAEPLERRVTARALPTAIPMRTILPYSLTPQAGVEVIGDTSDETPTSEPAAGSPQEDEPTPAAAVAPEDQPTTETAGESQPSADTGGEAAPTTVPEAESEEEPEAAPGGGCTVALHSAAGTLDLTGAGLLLGLVVLGLRRKRGPGS